MDWPEEFSKTTQKVRKMAYKQYEVEAITKTTLLPGQEKIGYHQQPLTTDYYLFLFTSRDNPEHRTPSLSACFAIRLPYIIVQVDGTLTGVRSCMNT